MGALTPDATVQLDVPRGNAGARQRAGGLDALRAIAALMVFAYHVHGAGLGSLPGPLAAVSLEGSRGVVIFFVISGFVLYRPMIARLPDLLDYALRRATRIYPAYVAALIGSVFLLGVAFRPAYLGFVQVVRLDDAGELMRVAWTLQAEVVYYAALPVLAFVLLRVGRPTLVIATLAVAGMLFAANVSQPDANLAGPWTPVWGAWAFLLGMLVARLPVRWPRVCALVGVALVYRALFDDTTTLAGIGTGIGAAFLVGGLRVLTAPRWLSAIGAKLSYSFYLWHWPALVVTGSALGGLGLALGLSAASWLLVERPFLELARRLRDDQPVREHRGEVEVAWSPGLR